MRRDTLLRLAAFGAGLLLTAPAGAQRRPVAEPRRQTEPVLLDPQPADHWRKQLASQDWMDRWEAVYALGRLGAAAEPAIPQIVELLKDREARVQAGAAYTLARLGDPAYDTLLKLLRTGDRRQRQWAVYALGRTGREDAVAPVRNALSDSREEIREIAADSLRTMAAEDPATLRALIDALKDPSPAVKSNAASALGHAKDAAAIAGLTALLGDEVKNVRAAACEALGRIGPPAVSAVPLLMERLSDDPYVQGFAILALGSIGPGAQAATDELEQIAALKEGHASAKAAWSLARIRGEQTGETPAP